SVEICLTAVAQDPCADVTDCITITLLPSAFANVGDDISICESETVQLNATATNYAGLEWQTNGDGIFDDPAILNPVYTPGTDDISNGNVKLTLTVSSLNGCNDAQDDLILTIDAQPTAFAGEDASLCEPEELILNGWAEKHTSVLWSSSGTGTFADAGALQTAYLPSPEDISNGTVEICLTAIGNTYCEDFTDCLTVTLYPMPYVEAGDNIQICETGMASLTADADNYQSLLWSTSGDGTFDDPAALSASYTPGIQDIESGEVILTLTASGVEGCNDMTDALVLAIERSPEAFAGEDRTICTNELLQLEAVATGYASVTWSTSGDGSFDDPSALSPVYTPGSEDLANGTFEICLTAHAFGLCNDAEDCLQVALQEGPSADAGEDATICEDDVYLLGGAASSFESVVWITTGDGDFSDPTDLHAVYTPGTDDLLHGEAILCPTANGLNNCGVSEDCMTLTFQAHPVVMAGDDITTCETNPVYLNGLAENHSNLLWSTMGDGSFDDASLSNAVYTPGAEDILNGTVELCLTAEGLFGCDPETDCLIMQLQPAPAAFAGDNLTICETEFVPLSGEATNFQSVKWITSGDGTFDNINELVTVYNPGPGDLDNGSAELCLTAFGLSDCDDAADCLAVEFQPLPEVMAGNDLTICETDIPELSGTASAYAEVLWTTTGDGTFADAGSLLTSYTPGAGDIAAGQAEICLNATGLNGCASQEDCLILFINPLPVAFAGNDKTVCEGQNVTLNGTAQHYDHVQWTTSGDGTFTGSNALQTTYIPGPEDEASGSAEICLTATGAGICEDITDCMQLTIQPGPEASAGDDITICETQNVQLNGTAQNHLSVFWTSSGTGGFSNPQSLNPLYMPSTADIQNGSVELCLKANGVNGCGNVTDCLVVTIHQTPEIFAGEDMTICENQIPDLSGTAENYGSIQWTTTGDGSFGDAFSLNTSYTPGPDDLLMQEAEICLTATGLGNCAGANDCFTLSIQSAPAVDLGTGFSVCQSGIIPLDAMAENYESLLWTTSGDGYFADPALLNAEYLPGPQDIQNGSTEVCLTAYGLNGCGEVTACMLITYVPEPIAFAGSDASILQGEAFLTDEAEASYHADVMWQTSGTGYFENSGDLLSTYYPSNADIAAGEIVLTLTANPIDPCTVAATDELVLTIYITGCLNAEANAGEDYSVCSDQEIYLEQAAAFFYESLLWTTSGDGIFNDSGMLNATYIPGPGDLAGGSVTLCLKAFAEGICLDDTDCVEVLFQAAPEAFAGSDNTIPKYEPYNLGEAWAENHGLIQWYTTNGTGSFSNENVVNPVYQPGPSDWLQGYVELGMVAAPINPCELSAEDQLVVSFIDECMDAMIDAGSDTLMICDFDSTIDIAASAAYYSGISWTTGGDGYFSHPNSLNTKYTLGPDDKANGEVMLYVSAIGFSSCSSATDSVLVAPQFIPEVFAGNDLTVCEGETVMLEDAQAQYYSILQWTSSGDGSFSDPGSLITEYTPGPQDFENGLAELTLTVESYPPCQIIGASSLMLNIDKLPEIVQDIEDIQVPVGATVQFFVAAVDGKNYQWYGPNGMIPGADDPVYLIPGAEFNHIGNYHCVVYNDCGSVTSSTAMLTVYEHQIVEIPAGWSGISSWIDPYNTSVASIFEEVEDELSLVSNFQGIYHPGIGLNTLIIWDSQQGYQTKFRNPVSLEVKGLTSTDRSVEIDAGWNYLAVISECPVNIADIFGGNPHVQIIKEIAGNGVYWPINNINTIGELIPGKAYFLRSAQAFTATYPECTGKGGFIANPTKPENKTSWNNVHNTPASHVVAIDESLMQKLQPGNVIGAFTTDGFCAGMIEIGGNGNVLTLYGDDPLTDATDGFTENEAITFRVFDVQTGVEKALNVRFDSSYPNADGMYFTNGLSGIHADGITHISAEMDLAPISIFPNPTEGLVNISGLGCHSYIEVFSADGQLLYQTEYHPAHNGYGLFSIDLGDLPTGVLYMRITNETSITTQKIIMK
ncbi:MAG: T9SS type A sorting domain-containing protein, partial [Bacteroidales bacterium]